MYLLSANKSRKDASCISDNESILFIKLLKLIVRD